MSFKSVLILVPLVLGLSLWQFGLTAPFLVEGLLLLVLVLLAFKWLGTGSRTPAGE
ncbi:MAG: hypothetical protein PVF74_06830 [Anaerolineales bacterium]